MVGTCHYTRKADTSVRQTLGFVVAISLAELGTLCAQSVACSPAAVTTDPNPIDTAYPPKMRAVLIPYRGAWGSPGIYSYSNVLEDVTATLTWLRQPAIADSMSVDPERLILVGHSLGGFAALYTAATTRNVLAVAALAPVDLGSRGAAMRDPAAFAKGVQRRGAQLGALQGTSGEELSREAVTHAGQWSLQRYAGVLATKRLLLLAATHDEAVPLSEVYEPLGAKLRAAGAKELTTVTLPSDHAFSDVRIGLAQALTRWLCEGR